LPNSASANGTTASIGEAEKDSQITPKAKLDAPSKNRLREQEKAERAVEEAEDRMKTLEQELADPAAWVSKYETAKSEARHTAATRAVEEAYARLEALVE
jgi:hypothetical protein